MYSGDRKSRMIAQELASQHGLVSPQSLPFWKVQGLSVLRFSRGAKKSPNNSDNEDFSKFSKMMMIFLLTGDCFTGIKQAVFRNEIKWFKLLQQSIWTGQSYKVWEHKVVAKMWHNESALNLLREYRTLADSLALFNAVEDICTQPSNTGSTTESTCPPTMQWINKQEYIQAMDMKVNK